MSALLEKERAALRLRQGKGARYDSDGAPSSELDWARRGTAYFARLLNQLADSELDEASAIPGLTRRHVVAHCGYQARRLGEFVAAARQASTRTCDGILPISAHVDWTEVVDGATLPARALRNLFTHAAVHLDVEWRDTEDEVWSASFVDAAGLRIALRTTPLLRALSLWSNALNLRAGGRIEDVPADFRQFLVLGGTHVLPTPPDPARG